MDINKGVNEAHHYNSILKASQEHMGDQVTQKMVSPWKDSRLSPDGSSHVGPSHFAQMAACLLAVNGVELVSSRF